MTAELILNRAEELREELIENRRTFHSFAETGFDLPRTTAFVEEKLRSYGLEPVRCGKAGITCVIGDPGKGKCFLLRGDMDALPMTEESGLPFAAQNGHCHSCGHDTHTAMLLAAARLLSEYADELPGCVKLMFQPAEELLARCPGYDRAWPAGKIPPWMPALACTSPSGGGAETAVGKISYKPGIANFSGDAIKVTFTGKDAHGSTPQKGVDAINIAAHAVIALQEILAREVAMDDRTMVLVGTIHGGSSCNTLSGSCEVEDLGARRRPGDAHLPQGAGQGDLRRHCRHLPGQSRGGICLRYALPLQRPGRLQSSRHATVPSCSAPTMCWSWIPSAELRTSPPWLSGSPLPCSTWVWAALPKAMPAALTTPRWWWTNRP